MAGPGSKESFGGALPGLDAPAEGAEAVTPSDGTELAHYSRALYVGGAGNVSVIMRSDDSSTAVVFTAVPAGTVLPIRCKTVRTTGTTATAIVNLW